MDVNTSLHFFNALNIPFCSKYIERILLIQFYKHLELPQDSVDKMRNVIFIWFNSLLSPDLLLALCFSDKYIKEKGIPLKS